jgi:uncharacterized protein (DUF488 family)
MSNRLAERIFSVGHSHHELAALIGLLQGVGINAVADVRSHPFSQRLPQFNRAPLEAALREQDIDYGFLGDLLGGRPPQPSVYDSEGRVDYEKVRATAWFQRGLDHLVRGAEHRVIAMLCSEVDPLDCHRGLMIAPALVERGLRPLHLRRDGTVESTRELEERLLTVTRVGDGVLDGLFADQVTEHERRELLAEAYRIQARRKAYRVEPDAV